MKIPENPMRIDPQSPTTPATPQEHKGQAKDITFSEQLKELLYSVNKKQTDANEQVSEVVTGESEDLHSAMIALEEASVSFQLMLEIRNKMLEAYQEINRMNI
jgi:flagellar hook-basal body complex protein FliE